MSGYCPDCGNTLCICPMVEADMVNSPPHYNQGRYEVIDLIENYFSDNYHLGNALKYLLRCSYKGEEEQDIKKMIWYAERYLEVQSNVGKDLGYNAWTCKRCKKGTNLVDKDWVCADCKAIEPEPTPNIPHFDSKPAVWASKGLEASAKVIPHNLPKDRLGAVTEPQNYRDLMSEKHYPDNQVHKEQLTLWEMVGYD